MSLAASIATLTGTPRTTVTARQELGG